jgi:hypothetical protein
LEKLKENIGKGETTDRLTKVGADIADLTAKLATETDAKKTEIQQKITTLQTEKATLEAEGEKKKQTQALDEEMAKDNPEATLEANEKPVKELVKKAGILNFKDVLDEIEVVFTNPKTFVFKRNSSDPKKQLDKNLLLMPDVTILGPKNAPAIASIFVYKTGVDPDQKEKDEAASKKAAEDKVKADARALVTKARSEQYAQKKRIQDQQSHEYRTKRMEQSGSTQRERIRSDTQIQLKNKEIEEKLREIRAKHDVEVGRSEMKHRQETRDFNAKVAEAKRKEGVDAKKELARIAADKKIADSQYKGELDQMKKDMVMALEKIKPGEGKMEEVKTNMRKNAITTNKNTTRNKNKNVNTNTTKSKNTTKKGKQKVCIKKAKGVKCYFVENKNGEMTIEPIPG